MTADQRSASSAPDERRKALTEAWQAVQREVVPLGGRSAWNDGYTTALNQALNAILALRDTSESHGFVGQRHMSNCARPPVHDGDCSSQNAD